MESHGGAHLQFLQVVKEDLRIRLSHPNLIGKGQSVKEVQDPQAFQYHPQDVTGGSPGVGDKADLAPGILHPLEDLFGSRRQGWRHVKEGGGISALHFIQDRFFQAPRMIQIQGIQKDRYLLPGRNILVLGPNPHHSLTRFIIGPVDLL
jgi:hypothetical protein